MLLMIDNYDSFTYNVVQYLGELGAEVRVVRNDEITVDDIALLAPEKIVVSPGPCTPNEAGISMEVVRRYAGVVPLLGICLGHQSIGQVFGGKVVRARRVMHGKTSPIYHRGDGVFRDLSQPFEATRYHSLVVERESLPGPRLNRVRSTKSWGYVIGSWLLKVCSFIRNRYSQRTGTICCAIFCSSRGFKNEYSTGFGQSRGGQ